MDRIPPGGSFEGIFYAQQQQQLLQQARAQTVQHPPSPQVQPFRRPSLPIESEMPDEWGYPPPSTPQVSNIPRNIQSAVMLPTGCAPRGGVPQSHPAIGASPIAVPACRHPNCGLPVTRDERTQELSEYCSLDHMRDAVQRLGYPVCPACRQCLRRSDSGFCGSLCEEWAVQQQRQQLQLQQLQSQELLQRHQQEHQQRHLQRQHWQPSAVPNNLPNSGTITWNNAARSTNNGVRDTSWLGRYQQ